MSGIQVEKRGTELKETDLPLTISAKDSLDWLIDRKKAPQDWKEKQEKMQVCFAKGIIGYLLMLLNESVFLVFFFDFIIKLRLFFIANNILGWYSIFDWFSS